MSDRFHDDEDTKNFQKKDLQESNAKKNVRTNINNHRIQSSPHNEKNKADLFNSLIGDTEISTKAFSDNVNKKLSVSKNHKEGLQVFQSKEHEETASIKKTNYPRDINSVDSIFNGLNLSNIPSDHSKNIEIEKIKENGNFKDKNTMISGIMNDAGIIYDREISEIDIIFDRLQKNFICVIDRIDQPGILIVDIETPSIYDRNNILEIGVVFWDKKTMKITKVFNSFTKSSDFDKVDEKSWFFKKNNLTKGIFDNIPYTNWKELRGIDPVNNTEEYLSDIFTKYPITGFNIKSFDLGALKSKGLINSQCVIPFDLREVSKILLNEIRKSTEEETYRFLFNDQKYHETHRAYSDAFDEAKILSELYKNCQNKEKLQKYYLSERDRMEFDEREFKAQGENLTFHYAKGILSYMFNVPENSIKLEKNKFYDWLRDPKGEYNKLQLDLFWREKKIAFEYNGRQHYECIEYYYPKGIESFQNIQKRDKIKRDLCKKNQVTLVEIPYFVPIDDLQDWIYLSLVMNPKEREIMYLETLTSQNFLSYQSKLDKVKEDTKIKDIFNQMPRISWMKFPSYSLSVEKMLVQKLGEKRKLLSHYLGMVKPIIYECLLCKERGNSEYIFQTTPRYILRYNCRDKYCYYFEKKEFPHLVDDTLKNEKLMIDYARENILPEIEKNHPLIAREKSLTNSFLRNNFSQFQRICIDNKLDRIFIFHELGYTLSLNEKIEYPKLTLESKLNEFQMKEFAEKYIIPTLIEKYPEIEKSKTITNKMIRATFNNFNLICIEKNINRKKIFHELGYKLSLRTMKKYPRLTSDSKENVDRMKQFAKEEIIPALIEKYPEIEKSKTITNIMLEENFNIYNIRCLERKINKAEVFHELGYKLSLRTMKKYPRLTSDSKENVDRMKEFAKEEIIPALIEKYPIINRTKIIQFYMLIHDYKQFQMLCEKNSISCEKILKSLGYTYHREIYLKYPVMTDNLHENSIKLSEYASNVIIPELIIDNPDIKLSKIINLTLLRKYYHFNDLIRKFQLDPSEIFERIGYKLIRMKNAFEHE